ncbi:hypothetical protein G3I31_22175 [Streptomyces sp. SID9913]|uniref:DUF6082 family protein n=1 Tax=Streptomyces sp. SID9913 TaxID=2706117 RepID=UPI0013DCEC20|nr:DUF6082 family protein [Streptomyces sp. SID9913]NED20751.1 hypothetical protein [Streptomyces sp. SID9913]
MATRKVVAGRFLPVVAAGVGFLAGAVTARAAHHRITCSLGERLERLAQATEEARRTTALAHQHRLHWELLSKAMDPGNAALLEVLDTYSPPVPQETQRQFLYANAMYTSMVFNYRMGILSREQFHGSVRGMFQNAVCRAYWRATAHHRETLDASSEEAELGKLVDGLLQQLEESDTDEWWVVGELPPETPPDAA